MKLSFNFKSDTPFIFPPDGHRARFLLTKRAFSFVTAALLAANMIYGQLVTHNSMAFSAAMGALCLLIGILMTAFPNSRLVKRYNVPAFGVSTRDRSDLSEEVSQ